MSNQLLMTDIQGVELSEEDKEILLHPLTGGLILFARNYESPQQLTELTRATRGFAGDDFLIAVDHEGGRVQRFQQGFTRLPPLQRIGDLYRADPEQGVQMARNHAWVVAREIQAVGIDMSFAPVLDVDCGVSEVIGNRSFCDSATLVTELASHYINAMHEAGMAATGKHFPGHGAIREDSHIASPVDDRPYEELLAHDMQPFMRLIETGLDAVMPAHVIYSEVDEHPAGFSKRWITDILRTELGFNGVVFSDDLGMEGAAFAGAYHQRAKAALEAGCDMVLACNDRQVAVDILDNLDISERPEAATRLNRMRSQRLYAREELLGSPRWQVVTASLERLA